MTALVTSIERMVMYPPEWSPDSKSVAFVRSEGSRDSFADYIYTVNVDGIGEPERIRETMSAPSWSPNGDQIAYVMAHEGEMALFVTAVDGTGTRMIASLPGELGSIYLSNSMTLNQQIRRPSG